MAPSTLPVPEKIEDRLFINGEFVPAASGKKFDLYNPATEKISAAVYEAGPQDVDAAVKAAKAAFPAWAALSADERASWILKLAAAIEKSLPEISTLDAITMGKPAHNDFAAAVGAQYLRYCAGKAQDISGETSLNTAGMVNFTLRQPYGVCGAIIPWNGPTVMLCFKVGPALISGNTLVLKSSEKAPLSALVVARLAQEIGLPPGVLNILSGFGQPCGEAIAKHMDIRKIAFTGSTRAGRAIKKASAESNLKNVTLELGGKSPLIIFDDANLDHAAQAAAYSITLNTGQFCGATTRIYVHKTVARQFLDKMKGAVKSLSTNPETGNNPLTEGTVFGPLADKLQFERVMSFLELAQKEHLEVALGGGRDGSHGYYVQPTIIYDPPKDSRLVREEIFGPIVCISAFTEEADALEQANDTEYGLYSSVYTNDISRALRFAKLLEAGMVAVNCTSPTMAFDMPFSGWKMSGEGTELSKHAFDHWTELKSVLIRL